MIFSKLGHLIQPANSCVKVSKRVRECNLRFLYYLCVCISYYFSVCLSNEKIYCKYTFFVMNFWTLVIKQEIKRFVLGTVFRVFMVSSNITDVFILWYAMSELLGRWANQHAFTCSKSTRETRTMCEIYSQLMIKTQERRD